MKRGRMGGPAGSRSRSNIIATSPARSRGGTSFTMTHTCRTSARFELKRLDELTPEQRKPFDELTRDANFYGLLVPRASSVATIKSVDTELAALLRALERPSPIDADDDIIDLVLDGVLEIEDDGEFVS